MSAIDFDSHVVQMAAFVLEPIHIQGRPKGREDEMELASAKQGSCKVGSKAMGDTKVRVEGGQGLKMLAFPILVDGVQATADRQPAEADGLVRTVVLDDVAADHEGNIVGKAVVASGAFV